VALFFNEYSRFNFSARVSPGKAPVGVEATVAIEADLAGGGCAPRGGAGDAVLKPMRSAVGGVGGFAALAAAG